MIIATKEHVHTSTQLGCKSTAKYVQQSMYSMYSKGSEALSLFQDKENQTWYPFKTQTLPIDALWLCPEGHIWKKPIYRTKWHAQDYV